MLETESAALVAWQALPPWKRRLLLWVGLFVLWTVPALLAPLQSVAMSGHDVVERDWCSYLVSFVRFWDCIPLTPIIFQLGRRYPLTQRGKLLWLHVPLSIVFALVTLGYNAYLETILENYLKGRDAYFDNYVYLIGTVWLAMKLTVYWLIVATATFLSLWERLRAKEISAERLERQLAEARLQTLQNQLRPHFLFNTLNSLSTLILRGDTPAAHTMLQKLAGFLRATLHAPEQTAVPLAREIELARQYLGIEEMRFGERLRVDIDVDPSASRGLVPPLLLQPLLENAVRHGIAPREAGGRIQLRARREGERLRLTVEDDGEGLRPVAAQGTARSGIGLTNTRQRLAELYGEDQRLLLEGSPGRGVKVTIDVPYREAPAAAARSAS